MGKNEITGVLINNGKKVIDKIQKEFKKEINFYKQAVKEMHNIIFRATHVKRGKRIYYYWYYYEWDPEKKRTVHKYIGKTKPDDITLTPPEDPLKEFKYKEIKESNDILTSIEDYNQYKNYFNGCKINYIIKNFVKER